MATPVYKEAHNDDIGIVAAHVFFTSGASGAVPAGTKGSLITSVTRTATGTYQIQFAETWKVLKNWNIQTIQASYSASGACGGRVSINAISSTGIVTVVTTTAAGAAVDASAGDVIKMDFRVQFVSML